MTRLIVALRRVANGQLSQRNYRLKCRKTQKNIRIAHLNINSIAGFKFGELKSFTSEDLFDIIVLSETKIDDGFPNSQFYINGYKMLRKDRNRHGGGLLIYVRRELTMCRLRDYECKNIEPLHLVYSKGKQRKRLLLLLRIDRQI